MLVLIGDAEPGRDDEPHGGKGAHPRLNSVGVEDEFDLLPPLSSGVGDRRQRRRGREARTHESGVVVSAAEEVALGDVPELPGRLGIIGVRIGNEPKHGGIVVRLRPVRDEVGELIDQIGEVGGLETRDPERERNAGHGAGALLTVAHRP